jgi:hypothetical protein
LLALIGEQSEKHNEKAPAQPCASALLQQFAAFGDKSKGSLDAQGQAALLSAVQALSKSLGNIAQVPPKKRKTASTAYVAASSSKNPRADPAPSGNKSLSEMFFRPPSSKK